jgi:hypothetical protein
MTRSPGRAVLLGAALLTCLAGSAGAAEAKRAAGSPPPDRNEAGRSGESVGAGGLTGSGATKDGARTGVPDAHRPAGSPTPAAGTTR